MNAIEALRKIANDDGCGCLPPCRCNNEDSLRIWKQEVQSIAREALSTPPSDAGEGFSKPTFCVDCGDIVMSKKVTRVLPAPVAPTEGERG
jgi:hypothetical protein